MAVEINKKRVVIIAAFAAQTQYLSNIIANVESDSDSKNEEFVQECINMKENITVCDKIWKANHIEGFIENVIPRLNRKQFKEHFGISPAVFENLENRLGNLLLRQTATGCSRIPVRKQLLATL